MGRELTKIVYRPSVEVNEDYFVIVNPDEVCAKFAQCLDYGVLTMAYVRAYSTSGGRLEVRVPARSLWTTALLTRFCRNVIDPRFWRKESPCD